MNRIKTGIFLIVSIFIYVMVFNAVNPEVLFSVLKGKVTQTKLNENTTVNYTGYKAGEDIQRLISSEELAKDNDYMTIDATKGYPLGLYKIKNKEDMENLKYIRNSKGRKIYDATKKIYEYVTAPGSLKAYYNSYYLVELQDGTYIVTYLDELYGRQIEAGKAVTLPIGRLEKMSGVVLEKIKDIKDKPVNQAVILNCFNEKDYKAHEDMYIIIRGGIALIAIVILYSIICFIFPKASLLDE